MITQKNMIGWFRSINFFHPISLSLSFSCVLMMVLFGGMVTAALVGGSISAAVIGGITLAGTVCLSSKWLVRKEQQS